MQDGATVDTKNLTIIWVILNLFETHFLQARVKKTDIREQALELWKFQCEKASELHLPQMRQAQVTLIKARYITCAPQSYFDFNLTHALICRIDDISCPCQL